MEVEFVTLVDREILTEPTTTESLDIIRFRTAAITVATTNSTIKSSVDVIIEVSVNNVNWSELDGSSTTIIEDSHITYNISQIWWRWYRIKTTPTKGSTTLTIHSVHKA